MRHSRRPWGLTRRGFLAGMSAGALLLPARLSPASRNDDGYPFDEIPADKSGIRWKHTSGKSSEKYLPESTGAGCAFLDYDNDGWMNFYGEKSGRGVFGTPQNPPKN